MRSAQTSTEPLERGVFFYAAWAVCLLAGLALIGGAYSRGFAYGFSFDDASNLSRLATVKDLPTSLEFVFTGIAGPTGRPVALLSFLLDARAWPQEPAVFAYTNVCIHLLNALLVIWLSFRLARFVPVLASRREWFALGVGLVWAASPILVSANLMIVQRMTAVSGLFTLAGLLGYVAARESAGGALRRLLLMSLWLVLGTLLSGFAKENGFLLPVLVLLLELLLFRPAAADASPAGHAPPAWWRAVFLWVPAISLLLYLVQAPLRTGGQLEGRDFDALQRLLTEARVLFQYLLMTIAPRSSAIGPYQDDFAISQGLFSPINTLVAVCGWLLLVVATLLARKRGHRLLLLPFAWFLTAHAMESTTLNLEIYFEHRNYIPSLGIVFLMVSMAFAEGVPYAAARVAVLLILLANIGFVFGETVKTWGRPLLAAKLWHEENPNSFRAFQDHAALIAAGKDHDRLFAFLDASPPATRQRLGTLIAHAGFSCRAGHTDRAKTLAADLQKAARLSAMGFSVTSALIMVSTELSAEKCRAMTTSEVEEMLRNVAESPGRVSRDGRSIAHEKLGYLAHKKSDRGQTLYHFLSAYALHPSMAFAIPYVVELRRVGAVDDAMGFLVQLRADAPWRPVVRGKWLAQCDELESWVRNPDKPLKATHVE